MQSEVNDLSEFTAPSSDQLNADDLIEGPRMFTIKRLVRGAPDPKDKNKVPRLVIHVNELDRPWKPCKGMTRLLTEAWGSNPAKWPDGCMVELFRDASVTFGDVKLLDDSGRPVLNDYGKPVTRPNVTGGVRVCGLYPQHEQAKDYIVTTGRGQRKVYPVRRLEPPQRKQFEIPRPTLAAVLEAAGLNIADMDAWATSQGKPAASTLPPAKQQQTADWLSSDSSRLDAIRAHKQPTAPPPTEADRAALIAEVERLEPKVKTAMALAERHGVGPLEAEPLDRLSAYVAALRAAAGE